MEVPVLLVRRDIESVISIRCDRVFLRPLNADAVLAYQSANSAITDVQTYLFQFFGHAWTAIAAQAETGLFLDVGQDELCQFVAFGWRVGCDKHTNRRN